MEATVVIADGQVIKASEYENPDLYVGTNIWIGRYVAISTSSAIYSGLRPPLSQ